MKIPITGRCVAIAVAIAALIAVQGAFDLTSEVSGPRQQRVCTR